MIKKSLTEQPVGKAITSMALPLLGGIYAMITFTLADTYFVSRLGTTALAAISFTFPVAMVLIYFIMGIGIGTASVVARAIGQNNKHLAARFATDGLLLGVIFVIFETTVGLLTIDPLFRFLGAEGETLRLIHDYMSIWYIAIAFFIISMISNSIIRATGDTKFPAVIMALSALINIILDPLLIFGYWGFPELGIQGAAWATLIAFALSVVALLARQHHYKLIVLKTFKVGGLWRSWREVLYIGLPSGMTNVIIHLAIAFITKLLATFSDTAVAGFGIAIRIEELALAVFHAAGGSVAPFVGQNFGAKNYARIHQGMNLTIKFSVYAGLVLAVILAVFCRDLASIFDDNNSVIMVAALYMLIVPVTYSARGVTMMVTSALNALGKPIPATVISIIRTFGLYIPLAYLGKNWFGITGIFLAALCANLLTGIGTYLFNRQYLNRLAPVN